MFLYDMHNDYNNNTIQYIGIDYIDSVIDNMKQQHSHIHNMKYISMDMLNENNMQQQFATHSIDMIIDKATVDAL